ncbi:MAG: hypothetical protein KBB91_02975 [Candidatus Pacebacteria bacterium]|jgi:hypothetical protein|nr:hypothetical protein [Candidatus Paceibacterota bacterium]
MRNSILALLLITFFALAILTNWFTEINGPVSDSATWFIWTVFIVTIISIAAIPWLKRKEIRHWIHQMLKEI